MSWIENHWVRFAPTYRQFEHVIETATGERRKFSRSFIANFATYMRKQRMNAKTDNVLMNLVEAEAAKFWPIYNRNVEHHRFSDDEGFVGSTYLKQAVEYRTLPEYLPNMFSEYVGEFIVDVSSGSFENEYIETFDELEYETSIETMRRWLDYIEMFKSGEQVRKFIKLRREFSILDRSYDLLDGSCLKQQ